MFQDLVLVHGLKVFAENAKPNAGNILLLLTYMAETLIRQGKSRRLSSKAYKIHH